MGEQPPFAGLGKLYFCRAEDKEPQPLGEAVALKPGMLTYRDDEPKSEYGAKGYSIGFNATMQEPGRELVEMLNRPTTLYNVKLEASLGRMPRKMKKALRARYRRDTKWKRKAKAYERRFIYRLPNAEMVVTHEQFGVLEATIKGSGLQYNPDAHVSGKDISQQLAAYSKATAD